MNATKKKFDNVLKLYQCMYTLKFKKFGIYAKFVFSYFSLGLKQTTLLSLNYRVRIVIIQVSHTLANNIWKRFILAQFN